MPTHNTAPTRNTVLTQNTSVIEAARAWHASMPPETYAATTLRTYRSAIECYIGRHQVAQMSLDEANKVLVLEPWLHDVARAHGRASARTARKMMSGTLHYALLAGAVEINTAAQIRPLRAGFKESTRPREADRSLTNDERDYLVDFVRRHPLAQRHDLSDLVAFMAGTGARISEALEIRWDDVIDADTDNATVHLRGTKTVSSDREVPLAPWAAEILRARRLGLEIVAPEHVVFTSARHADPTKPRNLHSTIRHLRVVFDDAGLPWATSHTFRHTVITRIVESGFDIGLAADFAGHASINTTQGYIGRHRDITAVAAVL